MTLPTPAYQAHGITLYQGEMEDIVPALAASGVRADAFLCDPPYCSGGTQREATGKTAAAKYILRGVKLDRPDFAGDQRDQDSLRFWLAQDFRLLLRMAKARCYLASFLDYRNVAVMIQAVQMAGWRYTDLVPWDKTLGGCRPSKGWFRKQCEYAVVGTLGSLGLEQSRVGRCHDGVFRANRTPADKARHMHSKPLALLQGLLGPLADLGPGGLVLDPFVGSGSTLLGARELGLQAIGIEREPENVSLAIDLLSAALPLAAALPGQGGG